MDLEKIEESLQELRRMLEVNVRSGRCDWNGSGKNYTFWINYTSRRETCGYFKGCLGLTDRGFSSTNQTER